MSRPKGSVDIKKRKKKVLLNGQQERELIKDYSNGVSSADILKKYNITKSNLSSLKKRRNIASVLDFSHVSSWDTITSEDFINIKNISGIYAIYFIWKYDINDSNRHRLANSIKVYIGSSVSIGDRLRSHHKDLTNRRHYNQQLQKLHNDSSYDIKYAIIERCAEKEIMQKESDYLNKWHGSSLLNTWKAIKKDDIKPWLMKALTMESYKTKYCWNNDKIYNGTPCKESICVHKSGYGRMNVKIDNTTKVLNKHRVAYWEKHDEYPELIRHLCNNKKCYNPDHLTSGNHRDNALDKRGDFPLVFENAWVENEGDLEKLSEIFGWKYPIANSQVYYWEKELDLRTKYNNIVRERSGKNIYDKTIKDFIVGLLDTHNKNEIQELCLQKFNVLVGDSSIYRLGSPKPILKDKSYTENPIYLFIQENLDKYVDSELTQLINLKFDADLSADRLTTMRFNWGLYRGGLQPEHTLKRLNEDSIYGIEFREFLRVNYMKYSDRELAELCILHKITNGQMPFDMSFVDFIKKQRLSFYGLLRDGEKKEPWHIRADGTEVFWDNENTTRQV
jgi:hypothetical protein